MAASVKHEYYANFNICCHLKKVLLWVVTSCVGDSIFVRTFFKHFI